MGEKDILEKSLCNYNDVFSDIVNNLLFGGSELVKEDSLQDTPVHSAYRGEGAYRELERDIAKHWMDNSIRISLLGIENAHWFYILDIKATGIKPERCTKRWEISFCRS